MLDALILIGSACISAVLLNMIFYKLNCSFGLFEPIRNLIQREDDKKKGRPRKISYGIILLVVLFMPINNMNNVVTGLIFGLMFSLRDICFRSTFLEKGAINERN